MTEDRIATNETVIPAIVTTEVITENVIIIVQMNATETEITVRIPVIHQPLQLLDTVPQNDSHRAQAETRNLLITTSMPTTNHRLLKVSMTHQSISHYIEQHHLHRPPLQLNTHLEIHHIRDRLIKSLATKRNRQELILLLKKKLPKKINLT